MEEGIKGHQTRNLVHRYLTVTMCPKPRNLVKLQQFCKSRS